MKNQYGEVIKIFNDKTNEIMEKEFDYILDADNFEITLDFAQVHYQRYSHGELLYEENAPEGFSAL